MSLTPTTRSTPQAALKVLYNIIPLDLHLTEVGLKAYLRLKSQLDTPWCTENSYPHLNHWDCLKLNSHSLLQQDDRCNITDWFKQYNVYMNSFDGKSKHIKPSEITAYTDGSKTDNGVGAAYVVCSEGKRSYINSIRISNTATVFQAEIRAIYEATNYLIALSVHKPIRYI